MTFEENFDYRTLVGRKVSVILKDYTEVRGILSLYGFKDKTVVVKDYIHILGGEVLRKGPYMVIKDVLWGSIAMDDD